MQCVFGAGNQNRTDDLVITNDVLYRLSHTSMSCDYDIISNIFAFVNSFLKNIFYFMLLNCSFSQKLQEIEIGFLVKNMKRQKKQCRLTENSEAAATEDNARLQKKVAVSSTATFYNSYSKCNQATGVSSPGSAGAEAVRFIPSITPSA